MPDNIWVGTTVENKLVAQSRISALNEIPARIRFLSCEPLLENLGALDLSGIGWIITGGESGKNARPCNLDWMSDLVSQCQQENVAVFVKQMGSFSIINGEKYLVKGKGADIGEFPPDLQIQQFPRFVD